MNSDPVHPYYRAILDLYAEAGRPSYHELSAPAARDMLATGLAAAPPANDLPELAAVIDASLPVQGAKIGIRRYQPRGKISGRCVYFHGGGWVIGNLMMADGLCTRLAAGAHCEVISVDYRLAPEHSYPVPFNDAYESLIWAASLDDLPLLVAGESAGGNLAAACAIRARDENGPKIAGQILSCPVTDCDFTTDSYTTYGPMNYLLSGADMQWFWDQYCPDPQQRIHPYLSPLRVEDARGLPPAYINVAALDPIKHEGIAYAERLESAGVAVKLINDDGMLHGYLNAAGKVAAATEAVASLVQWACAMTEAD